MKTVPEPSLELEDLFIETAGKMAESISINRVVTQLYALLYIRPNPVALEDMAERLKISKGSASVNIRVLETWNAVKKVWVQGSRKDYYTAEPDFMKIITERLKDGAGRRLTYANERMELLHRHLNSRQGNGTDKELKAFYQNRFRQLQEMKDLVESMMKFLPKIKSLKSLKLLASLLR